MINIPKGTKDVLPSQSYKWQYIENIARQVCESFAAQEIRTPVFEHTELFERGIGDTTDVVGKEMYTFLDKAKRSITLKPEGTAGVVRSYIENGLFNEGKPQKLFYVTQCYRYEAPQAGRLREFHQFGAEFFGSGSPSMDYEIISLVDAFLRRLGVKDFSLEINSIGCPDCRKSYNAILREYYTKHLDNICPLCRERLNKNPMRLLDCKNAECENIAKEAPRISDHICGECADHFSGLRKYLDELGVGYTVNPSIVRGLDYYTKTVFEYVTDSIGAKSTVCGGGRYDNLVSSLGGKPEPAVGFGVGIERLLMLIENTGVEIPLPNPMDVFVVYIGENARLEAMKIVNILRQYGKSADTDHMGRSVKAQFKYANKIGAKSVITIGDEEIKDGVVAFKDLSTGKEQRGKLESILKSI